MNKTLWKISTVSALVMALLAPAALAAIPTTYQRNICDYDKDNRFEWCAGNSSYKLRTDLAPAHSNRENTRKNIFGPIAQISDFQLADEESPLRLEGSDTTLTGVYGAYRPMEALGPQTIDAMVRAVNRTRSPKTGKKIKMVIGTGDHADNMQENEVDWFTKILNGGLVDPNSGDPNYDPDGPGSILNPLGYNCQPANYPPSNTFQGVKGNNEYYNPDGGNDGPGYSPTESVNVSDVGKKVALRDFPTLFDKANQPFNAEGLNAPWLITFGNHDGAVQGTFGTVAPVPLINPEGTATGCRKDPDAALLPPLPFLSTLVQPDPKRHLLSKDEWIAKLTADGNGIAGHGFDAAYPDQSYYSIKIGRRMRFLGIDTVNRDGWSNGIIRDGSLGEPDQFGWLDQQLTLADNNKEVAIVFGHHGLSSMNNTDTVISGAQDQHCGLATGASEMPGGKSCDDIKADYGNEPIEELFFRHSSVFAYIAGHSHDNEITPHQETGGNGSFWEIKSPSLVDWPRQGRMFELFNNRDFLNNDPNFPNCTFSIYTTMIDHAGPPDPGNSPNLNDPVTLASIGREMAGNDYQGDPQAKGTKDDRNTELMIERPCSQVQP